MLPILALALCATPTSAKHISNTHADIIAQDMVHLVKQDWPCALTSSYMLPESHATLEGAVRYAGFAVDQEPEIDSILAQLNFYPFLHDRFQAELTVNTTRRLSRMYQVARTELHPLTSFTLAGGRGIKTLATKSWDFTENSVLDESNTTEAWYVDAFASFDQKLPSKAKTSLSALGYPLAIAPLTTPGTSSARLGPLTQPTAARNLLGTVRGKGYDKAQLIAIKQAVVTAPPQPAEGLLTPPCTVMQIKKGSLRATIGRLLHECSHKMGAWTLGTPEKTIDWIITKSFQIISATGVYGLLDFLLNVYEIETVARPSTKIIDFRAAR